jgi:hypothetical protein
MSCGGDYSRTHLFGGIDHGGDGRRVKLAGVGWVNISDLPVITVHAPRAVAVSADGAVWGDVSPSDTLSLEAGGCGDWRIAAVRGKLVVHSAGSGDMRGDTAGALDLSLAGSGDVHFGAIAGSLDAHLAGSGDLVVDRVEGAVIAELAGSSDMKINGGHAPQLSVQIAGSGDFVLSGVAGSVSASVAGSGDIHVAHAEGPVAKSVIGSGDITVGR